MTQDNVLMIMNARMIDICLRSYKTLPIDRAYFTGYNEIGLETAISKFIEKTDYRHYLLISDDVIANKEALVKVEEALEIVDIATGYCNITPESPLVNLTNIKLVSEPKSINDYHFMSRDVADNSAYELFKTYLAGFMFTGMTRKLWQEFPFECYHNKVVMSEVVGDDVEAKTLLQEYVEEQTKEIGWGSDHCVSKKLQDANMTISAVRGAFCEHLGGDLRLPATLVGKIKPKTTLVKY